MVSGARVEDSRICRAPLLHVGTVCLELSYSLERERIEGILMEVEAWPHKQSVGYHSGPDSAYGANL